MSTTAVPSLVGGIHPVAGSSATSRQVVAGWYRQLLDAHLPIDRYTGSGCGMQRLDAEDDPRQVLTDLLSTPVAPHEPPRPQGRRR